MYDGSFDFERLKLRIECTGLSVKHGTPRYAFLIDPHIMNYNVLHINS